MAFSSVAVHPGTREEEGLAPCSLAPDRLGNLSRAPRKVT
jgi:hypothetical protein